MEDLPEGVYPLAPPMPESKPAKEPFDWRPYLGGAVIAFAGGFVGTTWALVMGCLALAVLAGSLYRSNADKRRELSESIATYRRAYDDVEEYRVHLKRRNDQLIVDELRYAEMLRTGMDDAKAMRDEIVQATIDEHDRLRAEYIERMTLLEEARRVRYNDSRAEARRLWETAKGLYAVTMAKDSMLRMRLWRLGNEYGIAQDKIDALFEGLVEEALEPAS